MAVVVVLALLYFANVYLAGKVREASSAIIEKEQRVERLRKQAKQVDEIRSAYKEIEEKMMKIESSIVNRSRVVDFIVEIENTAKEDGVGLEISISGRQEAMEGNFLSRYYSVKASGDFNKVVKFLVDLENLKYYLDLENIRISSVDGRDEKKETGLVRVEVELRVYMRGEKSQ